MAKPRYRLSNRADDDVARIARYTIEQFGIEQARRYRDGLEICFQGLAENVELGRRADWLAPNLRRFEHHSHVVFYTPQDESVVIARVLHKRMDMPRHF